jgi:flagellar biosynthesis/type III secretory pathway chaperone
VENPHKTIADIIEQESECLEEFLKLLVVQQKYLVENDIDHLRQGVDRQQELINRIKMLEKDRIKVLMEYSRQHDLDPAEVTMTNLANRAEGEIADKLMKLQNSLLSLHSKIEKAKRKNEFLIEHSMRHIEGTIKLIAGQNAVGSDYAPHEKKGNLMVSKTI